MVIVVASTCFELYPFPKYFRCVGHKSCVWCQIEGAGGTKCVDGKPNGLQITSILFQLRDPISPKLQFPMIAKNGGGDNAEVLTTFF
jgi:hypothetical protein